MWDENAEGEEEEEREEEEGGGGGEVWGRGGDFELKFLNAKDWKFGSPVMMEHLLEGEYNRALDFHTP